MASCSLVWVCSPMRACLCVFVRVCVCRVRSGQADGAGGHRGSCAGRGCKGLGGGGCCP